MINIIKQEITIDKFLKQRLEFICEFTGTTPTFINGSIRKIDKTNLSYVEFHKIIIKDKIFSKKDTREKYMDFSRDLYIHGIIDDKEMYSIKEDYDYVKDNDKEIEKDDFDISI